MKSFAGLGVNSNATMLYGHIESRQERITHMTLLREEQDRASDNQTEGSFQAIIPLPFIPGGVVIELVEPRKPCFVLDTISPQLKTDIVGRCGYLARVITQGNLCAGESISITKNSSS